MILQKGTKIGTLFVPPKSRDIGYEDFKSRTEVGTWETPS